MESFDKKNLNEQSVQPDSGEKRANFFYEFPGDKSIEVHQNKEGEIEIILSENRKKIFDFKELLPPGFKFINHELAEKITSDAIRRRPGWVTNFPHAFIEIGEFSSPRNILSVLHEIGHAKYDLDSEERQKLLESPQEAISQSRSENKKDNVLAEEEYAKARSTAERRAWAYAINSMRELQKKFGLDIEKIFPSYADLKNYINSRLSGYREKAALAIFENDPDFEEELKKLFDRWQYKKPSQQIRKT